MAFAAKNPGTVAFHREYVKSLADDDDHEFSHLEGDDPNQLYDGDETNGAAEESMSSGSSDTGSPHGLRPRELLSAKDGRVISGKLHI